MINAQFRLNYHTVVIKQFEKFGQPFQRLWVWAKPTNTFRLCNLMIAKQFAVLRLKQINENLCESNKKYTLFS